MSVVVTPDAYYGTVGTTTLAGGIIVPTIPERPEQLSFNDVTA